jgi:clan AA aspartic protease
VIGRIDDAGRALLTLDVRSKSEGKPTGMVVWVDTAFDGELVVPLQSIHELELPQSAGVRATLADGSEVVLETFVCEIDWFGEWRPVEVVANEGRLPLLGIGLLRKRRLTVDYQTGEMSLV